MATWSNRWEGSDVLITKNAGLMNVDEARESVRDFVRAIQSAPSRYAVIVDLSEYPTQSPEVADATSQEGQALAMNMSGQVCMAIVVAKTTTKMQLQRQGAEGGGNPVQIFCDDLDEARVAVREVLAAAPV